MQVVALLSVQDDMDRLLVIINGITLVCLV